MPCLHENSVIFAEWEALTQQQYNVRLEGERVKLLLDSNCEILHLTSGEWDEHDVTLP